MGKINEEFKTVAVVSSEMEAEIVAGMLRANGIPSHSFGASSVYPCVNVNIKNQGVQVKVNAEDYDLAMKLLSETQKLF